MAAGEEKIRKAFCWRKVPGLYDDVGALRGNPIFCLCYCICCLQSVFNFIYCIIHYILTLFYFFYQCMKVKRESEVAQSCPSLCDPMDCSLPGSSVHGIFQARVLEWGAIAFSHIHTTVFKINNQPGSTVQHRELCSIFCNNLNGKRIWKRMNICVCTTESICCTPETNTTFWSTILQNKIRFF